MIDAGDVGIVHLTYSDASLNLVKFFDSVSMMASERIKSGLLTTTILEKILKPKTSFTKTVQIAKNDATLVIAVSKINM